MPAATTDLRTEADVLSESTDLDTLLAAILGESDSLETIPPADAAAANDVPQVADHASDRPLLASDLSAVPAAWLAGPQSESELDAASPETVCVDNDASLNTDLAALRNRLQAVRAAESPRGRSNAWPLEADDRETMDAVAETDLRAGPRLLMVVDERVARPSVAGGVSQVSSGARHTGIEGTLGPRHRSGRVAALPKNARGLSLILVGVAVVVSGALITLNAISRAFDPPALPQDVGATSDRREIAAQAAALNTPAISSTPPAASASNGLRDRRTRPSSSSAAGRPNSRAVRSAPSPRGAVDASTQVLTPAAPPEPSSDSDAPPVPSDNPGLAASVRAAPLATVTEAPITPIEDPVGSAGNGEIRGAPQPPGQPQAEPPIVSGLNPLSSAAATTSRTAPRLLHGDTPEYPSVLRAARVRGRVDVQLTIDHTGRVIRAAAVSGPPALREAAERAVRGWRYEPATVNGVHAPAATTVSFYFEPK